MQTRRLPHNLLAFLIATHVLPAFAQGAPAPATPAKEPAAEPAKESAQANSEPPAAPKSAPEADAAAAKPDQMTITVLGNAIGLKQTRANVKITSADLEYYPPGVSADKVLERVSGLQLGSSNAFGGDGFESTINMRGFGKDSIGFSVDGIPNGRTTLGGGSVPTRYFDSSNLAGVDVSQSAGVVGSPSRQALVGHVNYLTQDPEKRFGARAEVAGGSAEFGRVYARVDSGELLPGTTAYLSLSGQQWVVSYVDDPAGKNKREHADLKVVSRFGSGAVVRLHSGYNNRKEESGTNIVTLNQFRTNPEVDGYTDVWTGVPSSDRNYRLFKGNPREDHLTYLDGAFPLSDSVKLTAKAYYHTQEGIGKESGLGSAGFPGLDGLATSLYFRANNYALTRRGVLGELTSKHSDLLDWRVGAWYEKYSRSQIRNWHPVIDEAVGPAHSATIDATSENKHWVNKVGMLYAANRTSLMGGQLRLDYGVTYMANKVDYRAPVHDSRTARFNFVNQADVNSGLLPKVGGVFSLSDNTELFAGYAKNAASVTDATLEGGSAASLATAATVQDMDTANAFDLGLRHRGENYALGVQVFTIESKETVAADIVGTLQSENINQGRRIKGLELTYKARLGDWRLYGAFTYQKGEYKLSDVDANGYPVRGFIRDGASLVGIADKNVFLEASWRPIDNLKLAMNARHVGERAGYYANPRVANSGVDERLPAYSLFGLNASYNFGSATVGLNVENLADKKYISGIAPELMTSPSTVGRYFIGSPRTVVLWAKLEI